MGKHAQATKDIRALKYSKELQNAIEDEARHLAIDAAKKRAAAQNVDYSTFAALVSVAHLKPLEHSKRRLGDKQRSTIAPAWSFDATGGIGTEMGLHETLKEDFPVGPAANCIGTQKQTFCLDGRSLPSEGSEVSCIENPLFEGDDTSSGESSPKDLHWRTKATFMHSSGESKISTSSKKVDLQTAELTQKNQASSGRLCGFSPPLMTSDAFQREWKRAGLSSHKKLLFLLRIPPHELPRIFKVEVPPSILADIIETLSVWKQSSNSLKQAHLSSYPMSAPVADVEMVQEANKTSKYELSGKEDAKWGDNVENNGDILEKAFDSRLVFSILEALSKCGRFSLSLKLMGDKSQSLAITLVDYILGLLKKNIIHNDTYTDKSPDLSNGISLTQNERHRQDYLQDEFLEKSNRIGKWLSEVELIQIDEVEQLASTYNTRK